MKNAISAISSIIIIAITFILLVSFCFMIYNQHQTNMRLQQTLDSLSSAYQTDTAISVSTQTTEYPTTGTIDASGSTEPSQPNQTSSTTTISTLEYSSAIAYLTKVQEVSSSNNSSSLLALIYTVVSSLVLTYGTKMLRLGENDKNKLIQEISEKSRNDISNVENQLMVKSSISNTITAVNSATSALQLVFFMIVDDNQESQEKINTAFMNSLSSMGDRLSNLLKVIEQYSISDVDLSELDSALFLFEHHFEIYKNMDLPEYIDDKHPAEAKVNEAQEKYSQITQKQSTINNRRKKSLSLLN